MAWRGAAQVLSSDIDLLHPPADLEKQKCKYKRLVQSPNSFFMDVKCQGCFQMCVIARACACACERAACRSDCCACVSLKWVACLVSARVVIGRGGVPDGAGLPRAQHDRVQPLADGGGMQ